MGNNHEKHFNKQQRKILIIGIEKSGKTSLMKFMTKQEFSQEYNPTKAIDMVDCKIKTESNQNYKLLLIDTAGGVRQRVFWRHNYIGTQGIIYVIDGENIQTFEESIQEFENVLKEDCIQDVPIAVLFSKSDVFEKNKDLEDTINNQIQQILNLGTKYKHANIEIYKGNSKQGQNIEKMVTWLLSKTVQI